MKSAIVLFFVTFVVMSSSWACPDKQNECKQTPDMPEKYRTNYYRAPTPACVPEGVTINTKVLQKLINDQKPVLIDVLGILQRPHADFGGSWLPNKEHFSVPGSVWLPNVGYGYLDEEMQSYFRSHLDDFTQGDKCKPLVFFCIADCWMSWNAVKRAYDYGYLNLYWYKNGTDGWAEAGLMLHKINPIPLRTRE